MIKDLSSSFPPIRRPGFLCGKMPVKMDISFFQRKMWEEDGNLALETKTKLLPPSLGFRRRWRERGSFSLEEKVVPSRSRLRKPKNLHNKENNY